MSSTETSPLLGSTVPRPTHKLTLVKRPLHSTLVESLVSPFRTTNINTDEIREIIDTITYPDGRTDTKKLKKIRTDNDIEYLKYFKKRILIGYHDKGKGFVVEIYFNPTLNDKIFANAFKYDEFYKYYCFSRDGIGCKNIRELVMFIDQDDKYDLDDAERTLLLLDKSLFDSTKKIEGIYHERAWREAWNGTLENRIKHDMTIPYVDLKLLLNVFNGTKFGDSYVPYFVILEAIQTVDTEGVNQQVSEELLDTVDIPVSVERGNAIVTISFAAILKEIKKQNKGVLTTEHFIYASKMLKMFRTNLKFIDPGLETYSQYIDDFDYISTGRAPPHILPTNLGTSSAPATLGVPLEAKGLAPTSAVAGAGARPSASSSSSNVAGAGARPFASSSSSKVAEGGRRTARRKRSNKKYTKRNKRNKRRS